MSFTIVSRPNYQDSNRQEEWLRFFPTYNKNSLRTRLVDGSNPLGEALKFLNQKNEESQEESGFSLRLTHPKSTNSSTVGIWKHEDQDRKYYVKDPGDLDAFNRPGTNILYLPTLQGTTLIDFCDISNYNQKYRYKVIKPQAEILGFPNSLASEISDVNGVFFQQVKEGEGINPKIIDLEYNPNITDDYQNGYCVAGWLNPLILILSVDGNDLEYIKKADKYQYLNAISLFIDPSALLLVEPHINESYDLRISILIKLYEKIKERERQKLSHDRRLSLIEYIFFSSQNVLPWKPFLILDLLGGKFYAKQNVSSKNDSQNTNRQNLLVNWELPQEAKSNKHWFANYWLEQWINTEQINNQSEVDIVSPPSSARYYRSSRGLTTFQVDDLSEDISLTFLLSKHPGFVSECKSINLYRFFVELFQNNPVLEKSLAQFPHYDFWRIENYSNRLVKFDEVDFWNYFSKTHFVPESPILIQIPQQKNRFLNPITSLNFGAYHFLWEFFNAFDSDRKLESIEFYNIFGWWNDWHSTIFRDRYDMGLEFINRRGFVIHQSLLGHDYLGEKATRIDWEEPNMRFSRS